MYTESNPLFLNDADLGVASVPVSTSGLLLLKVIDEPQRVRGCQATDGTRAVDCVAHATVRLDQEPGCVQEPLLPVEESAVPVGDLLGVKPVADRKAESVLSHRLPGVDELIDRGRDDQDFTLLELAKVLLEVSQLLTSAEGSPVSPVDQEHGPLLRRKAQ